MSNQREVRTVSASLRAVSRKGIKMLVGRAASFGTLSHNLGGFREIIKPGAFDNALRRGDETIFTQNHDPNLIMARTRNKSLRLNQSNRGLDFEVDLPDTQAAKDLWSLIHSGVISECSFAFRCDRDSWPKRDELSGMFSQLDMASLEPGMPVRMLEDLTLFDCSAVASPAYPSGTGVEAGYDDGEESSVDPAATYPHMEGASIPECVLVEARKRGGAVRRDPEHQRLRDRAIAFGKRIAWEDKELGRK
jgi:HK97 family phage prohead protease